MKVPFLNFSPMHDAIREEMASAFQRVYDSNWFVMGKELDAFEKAYSEFNQTNHAIGVSNGLDALHLSLKSLGVSKGDEVIVPSNTYIATVLAVSYVGATPVFVEPNERTYNIEADNIANKITSKTKAIIPVHLYGQSARMDSIMELANQSGLFVVEDNAQAHGAECGGKLTGSWGHLNATSFYPGKNLGALGDGGAITTNSDEFADMVKMYRNYGSREKYVNEVPGYNMRLDEMQAAFLNIKLANLKKWTADRQRIAASYSKQLHDIEQIILPEKDEKCSHVYHLYVIRTNKRKELQEYLLNNGVSTLIHYPIPPHLQKAYDDLNFSRGAFPIAEKMADEVLSLPLWPGMSEDEINYVSKQVRSFFK